MKLKTSVKISLKFTLFSVLLVFLFSVTIFSLYFRSWYSKSAEIIDNNAYYRAPLVLKLLEES